MGIYRVQLRSDRANPHRTRRPPPSARFPRAGLMSHRQSRMNRPDSGSLNFRPLTATHQTSLTGHAANCTNRCYAKATRYCSSFRKIHIYQWIETFVHSGLKCICLVPSAKPRSAAIMTSSLKLRSLCCSLPVMTGFVSRVPCPEVENGTERHPSPSDHEPEPVRPSDRRSVGLFDFSSPDFDLHSSRSLHSFILSAQDGSYSVPSCVPAHRSPKGGMVHARRLVSDVAGHHDITDVV